MKNVKLMLFSNFYFTYVWVMDCIKNEENIQYYNEFFSKIN